MTTKRRKRSRLTKRAGRLTKRRSTKRARLKRRSTKRGRLTKRRSTKRKRKKLKGGMVMVAAAIGATAALAVGVGIAADSIYGAYNRSCSCETHGCDHSLGESGGCDETYRTGRGWVYREGKYTCGYCSEKEGVLLDVRSPEGLRPHRDESLIGDMVSEEFVHQEDGLPEPTDMPTEGSLATEGSPPHHDESLIGDAVSEALRSRDEVPEPNYRSVSRMLEEEMSDKLDKVRAIREERTDRISQDGPVFEGDDDV